MIFKEEDKMTFGMFKGESIENLIDDESNYLEWCLDNVEFFNVSEELENKIRCNSSLYESEDYLDMLYIEY